MKLHDSMKGFTRGVNKVFSPEQTCRSVLRKLRSTAPGILAGYYEVHNPSTIPQYRVKGTDHYGRIVKLLLDVPADPPGAGSNGKGHCRHQALASGLMELVERYSCCKYVLDNRSPSRVYSFKELSSDNPFQLEHLYSNVMDEGRLRVLKNAGIVNARVRWYDGYSLSGEAVRLPVRLIMELVEGTNGMAAGNSLEEALLHALCEVIERHCESLIEFNRIRTPLIDISTVDSPLARKLIRNLKALHPQVFIKDLSLGIGLPVIGVVRVINKAVCMISTGVATTREEALLRALTENSQAGGSSNFKKIGSFRHYFAHDGSISLRDIPDIDNNNIRLELESIGKILQRQNMKAFYVDATDKALGIPSVIAFVSGAKMIHLRENITGQKVLLSFLRACLDTENYGGFKRHLEEAVKNRHISSAEYLYLKGVVLKRRTQYKKALPLLSRSVRELAGAPRGSERFNLRVKGMVNLGLCYQALNNPRSAIAWYLKAVDLSPDFDIEDLRFFYDNIRLLFRKRRLFLSASSLYRDLRLLRARLPGVPAGKFRNMFYAYQESKKAFL